MALRISLSVTGGLFLLLLWGACHRDSPESLHIATAANMQFAMDELTEAFSSQTGTDCEVIISSSGKLTAQIREGAPYDVFVSADMKYPQVLYEGGFTYGSPQIYAYGQLVLWSMQENQNLDWENLSRPGIKHIALANPKTAPYGRAAQEALRFHRLEEGLADKLVFGESIAQTNQFITSKAAEVGFTAQSVVMSPAMKGKGKWRPIDPAIYQPIAQGIVLLKNGAEKKQQAEKFLSFLLSEKGKEILLTYGYSTSLD
jgi:molybdate transport system substrate-binding protein